MSDNNIRKLLGSLVGPSQNVEDALQQLFLERSVDTAVGAQLDVLGRIVGQDRGGMIDDDFRRLVRARISVNRSKGTIADVLKVAVLVIDNVNNYLQVDNQGIATVVLRVLNDPMTDAVADLLIGMLRDTVSGGVRIVVEYSPEPVVNWFQLDVDNLDEKKFLNAVS